MEENILFNKNLAYHSVNGDIFKVRSILENGLSSFSHAKNQGQTIRRNYLGYNGDDYISLAKAPSLNDSSSDAFNTFIKRGISFVVDTSHYDVKKDNGAVRGMIVPLSSGVDGEIYIKDHIQKDDIIGLMIDTEMFYLPISELDLGLQYVQHDLIKMYVLHFIKNIVKDFNYPINLEAIDKLLQEFHDLNNASKNKFRDRELKEKINCKIKEINQFLVINLSDAISQKYQVINPTVEFIINLYNKAHLPIYNTSGIEIANPHLRK